MMVVAARGSSKSRTQMINVINEVLDKDANTINRIASEFPFGMDIVVDAYIQSGCSEQETRSILQLKIIEEV